jgi:hypothetical protein
VAELHILDSYIFANPSLSEKIRHQEYINSTLGFLRNAYIYRFAVDVKAHFSKLNNLVK